MKHMAKRIMIVDDEPAIRRVVMKVLEFEGFRVTGASDGPETLEKLRDEEEVNLALIDIFMPRMDGRNLIEKIREDPELRDLRVAILTVATVEELGMNRLRELGVLDIIQKPFSNGDLVQRVKRILAQ